MMKRFASISLALSLVGSPAPTVAQSAPPDADLATGIRQVNEGQLNDAILTLDGLVRRLADDPEQVPVLAQGYLWLGIAYASLEQVDRAKECFVSALSRDWTLHVSPDRFPPKVSDAFAQAREEARAAGLGPKDTGNVVAGGGLGVGAIVAIVAGVAGAGAAVAASGGGGGGDSTPANQPPATPAITQDPPGGAITGVTVMAFGASASDPDGDAVSYGWTFADDGSTATGPTVIHTFTTEGQHQVTVRASSSASVSVQSRTISGAWTSPGYGGQPWDTGVLHIQQSPDGRLAGTIGAQIWPCLPVPWTEPISGSCANPRRLDYAFTRYFVCRGQAAVEGRSFEGQLDATLSTISGVETWGAGGSASRNVTWTRQ